MNNLKGELLILDINGIKPNYSELARIYNKDRRTIKKENERLINKNEGVTKKAKGSILDKHNELIGVRINI